MKADPIYPPAQKEILTTQEISWLRILLSEHAVDSHRKLRELKEIGMKDSSLESYYEKEIKLSDLLKHKLLIL